MVYKNGLISKRFYNLHKMCQITTLYVLSLKKANMPHFQEEFTHFSNRKPQFFFTIRILSCLAGYTISALKCYQ